MRKQESLRLRQSVHEAFFKTAFRSERLVLDFAFRCAL